MLNFEAKLSHKIFSPHIDEEALRDGYGKGLLEAGKEKNVVVLTADLEDSTRCSWFKKVYPERFLEMGVAEQNMAVVAAGLSIAGKIPFINSYAVFSPGRNWEQIRTTIAYNDANVKIAGHHAGISTGPDGATHQATEDIAIMRAMPNMEVIVPCDAHEAKKATVAASKMWGPCYIRLQREKTPLMTTDETPYIPGKAYPLWAPRKKKADVLLAGAGPVLYEALLAAWELEKQSIFSIVLNLVSIKPLDEKEILFWAEKTGTVVSIEEHNMHGGVGSALAELFAKKMPMPMEFIAVQDVFGQSGRPRELMKNYHLTAKDIVRAAKKVIR